VGPARIIKGTPMTVWTSKELDRVGTAQELQSLRRDGTPRDLVTMWVVRDDDLYVRSTRGRAG
jgi:hypothetical protein